MNTGAVAPSSATPEGGVSEEPKVRAVVAGPDGRMGGQLLRQLPAHGIEVIGGLRRDDPRTGELLAHADVLIDFTNPESSARLMMTAIAAGVRPVVGTSGLTDELLDAVDAAARERGIGATWVPSFRIGAALMKHLAEIVTRFLGPVEIVEAHHAAKADAPSGTALDLAKAIRRAHGTDLPDAPVERITLDGVRGGVEGGVRVHSLRLPSVFARHEVVFSGDEELLTIRYEDLSRTAYAPVVAMAAREVVRPGVVGLVRGLDALLGLRPPA